MRRSPRPSRLGFTLLELIVVIVVLGVLAAIAVPTFSKVVERSRYASLVSSAAALDREAVALASYDSTSSDQVDPSASPAGGTYLATALRDTSGLSLIAVDALRYTVTNSKESVCLTLSGHPGQKGTVSEGACQPPAVHVFAAESFEAGLTGWFSGSSNTVVASTDTARTGTSSALFTRTSTNAGNGYVGRHFQCEANVTYTLTSWSKSGTGPGPLSLVISDGAGRATTSFATSSVWTSHSVSYTPATTTTCTAYALTDDPVSTRTVGSTYYLDDVTLTRP